MATSTSLNSQATSLLPSSSIGEQQPSSNSARYELCLPYDEAMKELPPYLKPGDKREQNELTMFLSQVDFLHKPVASKLSARFVFNFLEHIMKPVAPTLERPSEVSNPERPLEVTIPEQLRELTEKIAVEIASSIGGDFDLYSITISVLNILNEVSWETKAAVIVATFVLTFGDKGLNLCEESKVSIDEIQMFAKLKGGFTDQMEGSDNFFTILFKLIGSIVDFESLTTTYLTSKDPEVKVKRTHLIVTVYWIIKIVVVAATSQIIKSSSRGKEFDKVILKLGELPSQWSKKLQELGDSNYLKDTLSELQNMLKEDIDIEAYNNIKRIVKDENHSDNMEVLNALLPSAGDEDTPLYDCLQKKKDRLNVLKGEHVLLFISRPDNIAKNVNETELNELVNRIATGGKNGVECKIVWMPLVNQEATQNFSEKPFMDWCYIVNQKLNQVVELFFNEKKNFMSWYSLDDPSKVSNEVKKFIKEEWKYKASEPMMVALDPQGKVVNRNAIHMLYVGGVCALPFTSEREKFLSERTELSFLGPVYCALRELHAKWVAGGGYIFCYGGENIEWIRSFTEKVKGVASELGVPINTVYVGGSTNKELVQTVQEQNLSHCLSDEFYSWLFWRRTESSIHLMTYMEKFDSKSLQDRQRLLNYDKSNVGWVISAKDLTSSYENIWHGKVVLLTLNEFKFWKEKALNEGFSEGFRNHYDKLYKKIFPFQRLEFPTSALKAPLGSMVCPECNNQMQQYTTFICYHPSRK